jgi:hypothetical protein
MRQIWIRRAALCALVSTLVQACVCEAVRAVESKGRDGYYALRLFGRPPGNYIVRNANECAPDHAEPIWGASQEPVGYSCIRFDN